MASIGPDGASSQTVRLIRNPRSSQTGSAAGVLVSGVEPSLPCDGPRVVEACEVAVASLVTGSMVVGGSMVVLGTEGESGGAGPEMVSGAMGATSSVDGTAVVECLAAVDVGGSVAEKVASVDNRLGSVGGEVGS